MGWRRLACPCNFNNFDDPVVIGQQPKQMTLNQQDMHCVHGRALVVTRGHQFWLPATFYRIIIAKSIGKKGGMDKKELIFKAFV
jgi:hypothetical protein